MKAIYAYKTPLDAMCDLHPEVKDWWQTLVSIAQMELGLPPNPAEYWLSMTEEEQWKLVAELLKQTLPKDIENVPKINVSKIKKAAEIKPSTDTNFLTIQPEIQPIVDSGDSQIIQVQKPPISLPFTEDSVINQYEWITQLHEINCLLIYGGQGSGKSSFVKHEAYERKKMGHEVILLDPHHKFGDFPDIEVFGKGLNYEEIDNKIFEVQQKIKSRYIDVSNVLNFNPKPITIICEEFTNWSARCKNSDEFFMASLSDCRKIRIHVIYISHADTLGALTKRSGAGRLRDIGMTKLELLSTLDATGKTKPLFKANLYYPNTKNPIEVDIPVFKDEPIQVNLPTTEPIQESPKIILTSPISYDIPQADKARLDSVFGI